MPTSDTATAAPGTPTAVRRGKVGDKMAAGEVVTTNTGRHTTPFPKIDMATDRKAGNTIKRVDEWLMQNALAEAEARGDEFNARSFRADLKNLPPASNDSAKEYLLGDEIPPVVPKVLKPLTGQKTAEKASKAPSTQPSTRLKAFESERPGDDRVRRELEAMAGQAGWAQVGGELIRNVEGGESGKRYDPGMLQRGDGDVTGRTSWVPNAPWLQAVQQAAELSGKKNGKATQEAVRKALAGEPITTAERRHVESMLSELDAMDAEVAAQLERYGEEFDALLSAAAASISGVEDSVDNDVPAIDYALVQAATQIDEAAVERASIQAGDDDVAFMAAIREIVDGKAGRERIDRASGEVGQELQAAADREESGSEEGAAEAGQPE